MYGTREELCVRLENMFTPDEPLLLLVWTEEGVKLACRDSQPEPDAGEIQALMQATGDIAMTDYHREGVTRESLGTLLARQRDAANREVSVPAALLSRVLRDYARELEYRSGVAWAAGAPEPESVKQARSDVSALTEVLAA